MAVELEPTDVVIIGMGAAGGIAAYVLAQEGRSVVGLEAGPRYTVRDHAPDEIRNDMRNWYGRWKVNDEIPTWRPTPDVEATTSNEGRIIAPMANGVGGTSNHWTGQAWRLLPWHFRMRTEIVDSLGASAIPSDSTLVDWPITYDDLEPFYDEVERLVGISGRAGNIDGEVQDGGNPFEGPRAREYPLPPLRRTGWTQMMDEAAASLDWHPFPGPAGIRSEPYGGAGACTYHGFCTWGGCPVNAKATTSVIPIPAAEQTGNLRTVAGARVMRIESGADGRVTAVAYRQGNTEYVQPARAVLLGTYAYENTRLLLLSSSDAYPDGLANNSGQVGRHYMSHVFSGVNALYPDTDLSRFNGTAAQATCLDDFHGPNLDYSGLGFIGGGLICAGQEQKPIAAANATPTSVAQWGSEWKDWISRNARSIGSSLAQLESLPYEDSFMDLDPQVVDPAGVPVVRVTFRLHDQESARYDYFYDRQVEWHEAAGASETWVGFPKLPEVPHTHAYGGTRMGTDPATTVVDEWCMSHEAPNLGVIGASCFPTTTGYNPTLTVQALAWRTAKHLADEWDSIAA